MKYLLLILRILIGISGIVFIISGIISGLFFLNILKGPILKDFFFYISFRHVFHFFMIWSTVIILFLIILYLILNYFFKKQYLK